jgi:uncharacterized protein (TIGR03546 family)
MFTLKKIWNALNHAGKPWQISYALAFGMIVGFTPLLSIHNLILFFLVLLLNIHLGIFILAVSFFGILGLILDPLFTTLGTTILTTEGLNSLFTQVYNNPIGYLSGFNNTILMGSLIVSIVLFFFVYKLSSVLIVKYRTVIATKIKNIPLLNKLQFFQNEDVKKVKIFRIIGVIVFIVLLGILSLFKLVFFDEIVKSNLEKAINKSSDKIVAIKTLTSSILNSSVVLENIDIKDKKDTTNNINIKNITLDINLSDLIFKRVIIENLKVDNISFPNVLKDYEKKVTQAKSTTVIKQNNTNESIRDLASLKNINTLDIQKGFELDYKKQFDRYREYYEQIKPLFNAQKKNKIQEQRADGKFIYFNIDSKLPDFLIKKGTFSLLKDDVSIIGKFADFTTNQNFYQKPFRLNIDTKTKNFANLNLNFTLLEVQNRALDTLHIKVKELKINTVGKKNITISNTLLNTTVDMKITDKINLEGVEIIDVLSSDIAFKETNKYIGMLNKTLVKTQGITGKILFSGTMTQPKFKINSNMDKILKDKIKTVLNSNKDTLKKEIKEKVKDKIKDKLKGILGF